jgi:hypothetical protein
MAAKVYDVLKDSREAAEVMRLVRAWDMARAMLSKNNTNPVDTALRLPPNHPTREVLKSVQDILGRNIENARKGFAAVDTLGILDSKLSAAIDKLDTALAASTIAPGSPQANAVTSLRDEFKAVLEIRDTSLPLSLENHMHARLVRTREVGAGNTKQLPRQIRHPLMPMAQL